MRERMKLNTVIHGNVLEVLRQIPSNSIDCIITSPPYWGLRKYPEEANVIWGGDPNCEHEWIIEETKRPNLSGGKDNPYAKEKLAIKGTDNYKEQVNYHHRVTVSAFCKKCGAWYGQLGLEPTPEMYVEHLGLILKEIYRVLKPTGTFWLNIGDTYSGSGKGSFGAPDPKYPKGRPGGDWIPPHRFKINIPRKCMLCIPERVLFKCLEIGFILRNKIIWYKPNHLPSSVKDRLTNTWEYVYLLTKKPKYYFNLDAIRVPLSDKTMERVKKFLSRGESFDPNKHKVGNGQNPYQVLQRLALSFNYRVREAKKGHFGIVGVRASEEEMEKYDEKGVKKHDVAVGRVGNFSYPDPLHTKPIHYLGKNPGDYWEADIEELTFTPVFPKFIRNRKYTLIENYFEKIVTEEQAYWLGFLWADGHVNPERGRIVLTLKKDDWKHVFRFAQAICTDAPIRMDNEKCVLEIHSKKMCKDIIDKNFRKGVPKIPAQLIRHFIRGFFDGDGTITKLRENEYEVSFTNSDPIILKWIGDVISNAIGCKPRKILKDHNAFRIRFGGTDIVRGIRDFFYENSTIFLERKYQKFPKDEVKWHYVRDTWSLTTEPFPEAHFACVDEETEVLTKNGWKKWHELSLDDEIATFDIINETIHYHKPYDIFVYDYDGELVVIENQWVAQYVTPNHRVLLKYIHSAKKKQPDDVWHYVIAEKITPHSGILIPLSGRYDGEISIGENLAYVIGFIIGDGNINKKYGYITIYQNYDKNKDKVEKLLEHLRKGGIRFTTRIRTRKYRNKTYNEFQIYIGAKDCGRILKWFKNFDAKQPKWELLHLRHNELRKLFEGLIDSDGVVRKDGRIQFIQKSEYIRDFFRVLCVHLGLRTTEYSCARNTKRANVNVTNKNYAQIHQSDFKECIYKIRYKGKVWCPFVPNTNFVARRKGKNGRWRIFITGNTFPIKLVVRCIVAGCPPDGVVLDPFMGSGTVALACELLNHKMWDKIPRFEEIVNSEVVKSINWNLKWLGIEIVKDYIEMTYRRLNKVIYNNTKPLTQWLK